MKYLAADKQAVSNVLGYAFAFSICALIMIASVLITTSMISGKSREAAEVEAQSVANQVANALLDAISAKQSMPDTIMYETQVNLPRDLIGSQYYVEVTDTTVYVNTTDGQVSRSSINYNSKDLGVTVRGRVYGGGKGLTISFSQSVLSTNSPDTINLDFSVGNITNHSPVETGYYFVSDYSDNLPTTWDPPWWNTSYKYRIPLFINNTVPVEYKGKYYASNLTNTSVKIILSSEDIDYKTISISGSFPAYAMVDGVFYDPSDSTKIRPYFIDWQSVDWQKKNGKTIFYVNLSIHKNTSKYIYFYYGAGVDKRSYHSAGDVADFYDNFNDVSETWNKTYDNKRQDNIAYGITNDSWSNIYVVGTGVNLVGPGTGGDWWIKKFDINGYEYTSDEGWNKTIDSGSSSDIAYSVATDRDSNVYVVGCVGVWPWYLDWCIKKFNSNGIEYPSLPGGSGWNKRINNGSFDVAVSVTTDPSMNVYVVGCVGTFGYQDWMVRKYTQNGVFVWEKRYDFGGSSDIATSVAFNNNYLYIAGVSYSSSSGLNWTIKRLNANYPDSSPITKFYTSSGNGPDQANSVTVDADGNVYVVGYQTNGVNGKDMWIKKFNSVLSEDTVHWNKIINNPLGSIYKDDIAWSVTTFKNWTTPTTYEIYVYVAGSTGNNTGNHNDWWIKKFRSSNDVTIDGWEYPRLTGNVGWNKRFDGAQSSDEAKAIKTDRIGDIYVAGYGKNIVNNTLQTQNDWWIKKFDHEHGSEISGGLSIDPAIWNLSSPATLNAYNYGATGKATLPYSTYIMTKNYSIKSPSAKNESMYIIDMVMNLSYLGKNGSMIFLSKSNKIMDNPAYKDSYSVKLSLQKGTTSKLMLTKYITGTGTSSPSISIPTPVHRPTNQSQYVRITSYVHLDNTTPSSPVAFISSYLFDEGPSNMFTPFEENFSFLDTANPVYLGGYIGIAAHGPMYDYRYICVDWIRVLKVAPSFQPTITIGPMESINYIWDHSNPGNAVDRIYFDPFSPDPVNRDYINVSKDVNFSFYNIAGNGATFNDVSIGTMKRAPRTTSVITITMIVGDRNGSSYPCYLNWTMINHSKNKPPEEETSTSAIELPLTNPGQFKKVQFELTVPAPFQTIDIILHFSGITGYPSKTVAVTSITLQRDSSYTSIKITPR